MFKTRHILNLILLLAAVTNVSASTYTTKSIYVSPGISVGYTFGQGFNYGAQVSIGLIGLRYDDDGYFSGADAWLPTNEIYPAYSISYGFRNSKLNKIKFIDLQVFGEEGGGAGVGLAKITEKSSGYSERYNHLKLYLGFIPLAQLDIYYQIRSKSIISGFGVIGVLPIPVVAISKDTDEEP